MLKILILSLFTATASAYDMPVQRISGPASDSSKVAKAGDTMSGALILASSSTTSNHEILLVKSNAGDKIFHVHEGDGFSFFSDTVTIKSNGRVGIGTGTPTAQLDLIGTDFPVYKTTRLTAVTNTFASSNMFLTHTSGQMADGFGGGLVYAGKDADGTENVFGSVGAVRDGADNSGALYFNTYLAGGVNLGRVVVKASGNVGINTLSPGAKLDVAGGVGFYPRTMAQLLAITPSQVGVQYFCNNCSPAKMVVSTGTAAGNFADIMGGTFQ